MSSQRELTVICPLCSSRYLVQQPVAGDRPRIRCRHCTTIFSPVGESQQPVRISEDQILAWLQNSDGMEDHDEDLL